ncbi:hypothetical protein E8E12_003083 [Didymella heteroderae]|uniref:Uncharacterized protein n=1 Tax=Didymella heteroderae TaxID=1769908 RepID=A0A9P4WUG8_9PLEO|nr:hypothetical protein E8E12_003083 [Didymella heteroderae]
MAPTIKQLQRSNIRVKMGNGVTQRVRPIDKLNKSVRRYLPPAGAYYDQSILAEAASAFDTDKKLTSPIPTAESTSAMFFSQSVYGARPRQTGTLRGPDGNADAKPPTIKTEEASSPLEDSSEADGRQSCIPLMEDPLTMRLLIHHRDERRVSPTSNHTAVPSTLVPSLSANVKYTAALKYPVERYLPPSGPYYDQCTFASVMHQGFRKNKKWCASCWMPRHGRQGSCLDRCSTCSTKQHTGKVCPQLYCDARWYRNRGVPDPMLVDPGLQIRPDLPELATLSQIGVLQPSNVFEDLIIPIMTHPVCRKFYGNGPGPKPVTKRRAVDEARTKPSMVTTKTADTDPTRPVQLRHMRSSEAAEASHDLHSDRANVDKPSSNNISTAPAPIGDIREISTSVDAAVACEELIRGLEAKVLCLEEEVLVHKRSGIEKDRRIRALEGENQRLRRGEG